jgi:hypothetical protein
MLKDNASARKWLYLVTGLLAAIVPILVQTGLLDSGQGDSSATLITSLVALLGGGGALTAAHHTNQQIKAGVHDPALSPIDAIQEAIPQVLNQAAEAQANVDKLRQVTGDLLTAATGSVPVLGPVVADANSLAQQALDQILKG